MTRIPGPHRAAAVLALGLLALTRCGTTHAGAGVTPASPTGSPQADASASAAAAASAASAAHDAAFPEVAARCAGAGTAPPPGSGEPGALPTDPEAAKYAENHAFKQQSGFTAAARCRGEAHAQRLRKALTGPGATPPADEAALAAALERLGYHNAAGSVHRTAGGLGFSLFVPEVGPCVTADLGTPVSFEAHGVYAEGGCTEPRGGH